MDYDYIIIGGGIVGISTAWQLQQRHRGKKILIIEKDGFATHQTAHNSGVIHAGVYYAPGSLKATLCKAGSKATISFCQDNGIAHNRCGKLLVATSDVEMERMDALFQRCLQNEISVELLTAEQLSRKEPNIQGKGAIFVHDTAIVDYRQVALCMLQQFIDLGGKTSVHQQVTAIAESSSKIEIEVRSNNGEKKSFSAQFLICCGGLMADRLARMMSFDGDFRIIPYRGEYYRLAPQHNNIVNHLIYPIPDPELPFLGVHLTRMIDGSVTVGPNAVQGWKREGYGTVNINLRDIWEMVSFAGFWKVLRANFTIGLVETKNSLWKPGYLKQVQKYCPKLKLSDLHPYPAGIRAQAVLRDGSLVHDFLFKKSSRSLHVCNAPSPAATSAIPIGSYICDRVEKV